MQDYFYISLIDASIFFYQWRVHFDDRHKLIVVTHKKQKSFNVIVMKYKNFSAYVQKQIDRLLKRFRRFARVYVDDIIIFFKTFEKHKQHLRFVFVMLQINNIFIKSNKIFLKYLFVALLSQKMNFFDLFIRVEKLKIIVKIRFFKILRLLKHYLDLTDYFKKYVSFYVDVFKAFQIKKTKLLKSFSIFNNVRKIFFNRIKINNSTSLKLKFFRTLQSLLFESSYLIHYDRHRQLFVDLNVSKKFDFDAMIYHVKFFAKWNDKNYSSRKSLKSILFFNWFLIFAETRYWSTKLKIIDIVWVLKKIKHLMKSFFISIVIYTNHDVALNIIKQTTFTTFFIDKLNFRFIRTSNYIQRFNVELRHKSNVQHIISNAFFRFVSLNIEQKLVDDEEELNVLFTTILIKMNEVFRNRLLKDYRNDFSWKRIFDLLNAQINIENNVSFFFIEKTSLFFALMITLLKVMFLSHANSAFHNYWLLIFSIRYTTSSVITLNFENVTNDLHFFTSYANYSSNFVIIFVIIRIVKYIKFVVINHTIFCSQYWRRRYSFTLWS